jgi:hypothetical protein
MPTAAVVVAFLAQVALVQCWLGEYDIEKIYIIKIHYLMIFEALGLPHSWYATPSAQKNGRGIQTPCNVGSYGFQMIH